MVHIWMMLPQKSVCNNRSFVQCSCISALSSKLIHDLLLADNVCWHHPTPNQDFYAQCSPEQTELKNSSSLKNLYPKLVKCTPWFFFPHSFSRWLNCAYTGSPFESKNSSLVKIFVKNVQLSVLGDQWSWTLFDDDAKKSIGVLIIGDSLF